MLLAMGLLLPGKITGRPGLGNHYLPMIMMLICVRAGPAIVDVFCFVQHIHGPLLGHLAGQAAQPPRQQFVQ
jgi:hypothetical protein